MSKIVSKPKSNGMFVKASCPTCHGNGRCSICQGTGVSGGYMSARRDIAKKDFSHRNDCKSCGGTGTCGYCGGAGRR